MKKWVFIFIAILSDFLEGVCQGETTISPWVNQNRIPLSSLQSMLQLTSPIHAADLGVSTSNDGLGYLVNPAKSFQLVEKGGAGISYAPHESRLIKGQKYYGLNTGFRIDDKTVIGLAIQNFKNISSSLYDVNGAFLGEAEGNDIFFKANISRQLTEGSWFGMNIGYYSSKQFNNVFEPVRGANFDLGYFANFKRNIVPGQIEYGYMSLGVSVVNIGPKVKFGDNKAYSFAPQRFRIGTSYNYRNEGLYLTPSFEISKDLVPTPDISKDYSSVGSVGALFSSWGDAPDGFKEEMREIRLHLGVRADYKDFFGGLGLRSESKYKGDRKDISVSVGHERIQFDNEVFIKLHGSYAFDIGQGVSPTFRLGIQLFWDKEQKAKAARRGEGITY